MSGLRLTKIASALSYPRQNTPRAASDLAASTPSRSQKIRVRKRLPSYHPELVNNNMVSTMKRWAACTTPRTNL